MRLLDQETVDGTSVVIGRRVQRRVTNGRAEDRPARSYTAQYTDLDGVRRFEGLGTTNKREARRKALEIQSRLDGGHTRARPGTGSNAISVAELIRRYTEFNQTRGLAPKTLAKYRAELDKVAEFCREQGIERAAAFDEEAYYRFAAWLRGKTHKQGLPYSGKSLYTALTVCKQLFLHGWKKELLRDFHLAGARLPSGKARPQPCFTTEQVEALLGSLEGEDRAAFAIGAYLGFRVGEIVALRWEDVHLDRGDLGVVHIRRGGSAEAPKDKEHRFIPIHPRLRPIFEELAASRSGPLVLPGVRDRTLLARLKRVCKELGLDPRLKVHSLRHHFASMCANSSVPYRLALAWMGHSSSEILDLYYHLSDAESVAAMKRLAEGQRAR